MDAHPIVSAATVLLAGWVAGAEWASWALVQPVIARLDTAPQIRMHQGMLGTYGRFMPVLLPLLAVLLVASAVLATSTAARTASVVAAACAGAAIVSTLTVNVPINNRTGRWDPDDPPADWRSTRDRWHAFQGLRVALLALALFAAAAATALR